MDFKKNQILAVFVSLFLNIFVLIYKHENPINIDKHKKSQL